MSTAITGKPRQVPRVVRYRHTLVHLADAGIGMVILCAVIQFRWETVGQWLALASVIVTSIATDMLRSSIREQDNRPDEELDEYELQRKNSAKKNALRWSTGFLFAALVALVAITIRAMDLSPDEETLDSLVRALASLGYFLVAAILFLRLLVQRSIAGGMNKDILISGDSDDRDDSVVDTYDKETS
ncbi:MAG TPA: hypothetical protein H9870_05030 [Candidatus Corynebacterium avicola]|uniref:Uncharacterized protein n=1 Tax=Candidatus Corynebacterium avicola TaxID=2838527 RepID=A0A9D1RP51_9CORY|nr:hypothetical protein [Candidatus Corynebacterium avicola]